MTMIYLTGSSLGCPGRRDPEEKMKFKLQPSFELANGQVMNLNFIYELELYLSRSESTAPGKLCEREDH